MINIFVKKMTGELLSIEYNNEWSAERLHDCVYDALSVDERPLEKWKIMLFLRGEWLIANKSTVDVEEGEVLDLLIETGTYDIDFPLEDYKRELWLNILQVRGTVNIDFPFYVNEDTGMWYFNEEVEPREHKINPNTFPHLDAHEFTNTLDLPLCVREFIYSSYCLCYAEILPPNAPRPIPYYCSYEYKWDEDGMHIDRPPLTNIESENYIEVTN